jgi:hypothetical protein
MIVRALVLLIVPGLLAAQAGRQQPCRLVFDSLPNSSLWQIRNEFTGQVSTWISGGVRARYTGTSIVISADSAEYSSAAQLLTLIGNARYRDATMVLDANFLRYFEDDARVEAQGNVRMRTTTNTTLRALQVIHLRDIPGVRQSSSLALGRPRAVLRDSAATADSMATTIDAERMYAVGDSLLHAGGNVVITRPGIKAYADSTEARVSNEFVRLLRGEPRIEATGARPFTLRGQVLDIFARDRLVRRLLASGAAQAISDSLSLLADTLDLAFEGGGVERVQAWGTRARAVAQGRDISADSLDIKMPGQLMQEVIAIGGARVESDPDTAIVSAEKDWIAGDTVRATFEPPTPGDTARQAVLQSVEARGTARSFFQMPPRDRRDTLPAINYVTGRRIDLSFKDGEIALVHVTDQARGIYLEPGKVDSTPPATRRRGGGRP